MPSLLKIQKLVKTWLLKRNHRHQKYMYKLVKHIEFEKLCQIDDSIMHQNRINLEMISKSLTEYREKAIEGFEHDWIKFSNGKIRSSFYRFTQV